ncbi:MAG: PQQ-binding-like beta-propeller repeat protein [Flavobacteriales bacterium]|nr:PQQ-binding-like beta-propeller repeat protein [Flavobacteriales bacterium]
MHRKSLILLSWTIAAITTHAQTYELIRHLNVASGSGTLEVRAMAHKGDTLFVGGDFQFIAQPRSYGTIVSSADGSPDRVADRPNARVRAAVADGQGGWFLGGDFTLYNNELRNGLAHMGGDGQLIDWVPEVDPSINGWAIALHDGWVFTADDDSITAVDAITGQNIGWSMRVYGEVRALAAYNGILYVGGDFQAIGLQPRINIAAIDIATGQLSSWNVSCNGPVHTLTAASDALYMGGDFSTVAGSIRNGACAVNYGNGLCTPWNPNTNSSGVVNALAIHGDTVYFGGEFTSVGGTARGSLAAVDRITGSVLDWNAPVVGTVHAVCVDAGLVFVGGYIQEVGGEARKNIAAVDAVTGVVPPWNTPSPDTDVHALAPNGSGLLLMGGDFMTTGNVPRSNLAAISLSTGEVLPWRHDVSGPVNALCVHGDRLFIGGQFGSIDVQSRQGLGVVDLANDELGSWAPEPSGIVNAVAVHGSRLYVGGAFPSIAGESRNRAASFELGPLELTGWNPLLLGSSQVLAFGFHEHLAYVGSGLGMAVVDTASALIMPFTPDVGGNAVRCFANYEGTMYFVGGFYEVNGVERRWAAAVDAATGVLTPWDVDAQGGGNEFHAVAANASSVFIGGTIETLAGTFAGGVAPVDHQTGAVQIEADEFSQSNVLVLDLVGSSIYVGGGSYSVFGSPRRSLAGYTINDLTTEVRDAFDVGSAQQEIRLWPSPYSGGALQMAWNSGQGSLPRAAELLDASGRILGSLQFNGSATAGSSYGTLTGMDELDPVPGLYFVRMPFADGVRLARVVVE